MNAQDRQLTQQMLKAADRGDWFAVLDIREQLLPSQRQYSRHSGTPVATARTAAPAPTPARSREQVETDRRRLISEQLIRDCERLERQVASTPREKWKTAWHESGHALAAVLRFGSLRAVQSVEVFAEAGDWAGVTILADKHRSQRPADTLIYLAAGAAAEALYCARSGERYDHHDDADLDLAGQMLGYDVSRNDAAWDAATTAAWGLMRRHMVVLRDHATNLHSRGRLECADVARIVGAYSI